MRDGLPDNLTRCYLPRLPSSLSFCRELLGEYRHNQSDGRFILSVDKAKKPTLLPYQNLIPLFEIDYSSVRPRFEIKSESSLMIITRILEEIIIGDMVENDFIVKIPPVKVYSIRLRVKSIKRATPRITEPEGV